MLLFVCLCIIKSPWHNRVIYILILESNWYDCEFHHSKIILSCVNDIITIFNYYLLFLFIQFYCSTICYSQTDETVFQISVSVRQKKNCDYHVNCDYAELPTNKSILEILIFIYVRSAIYLEFK